MKEVAKGLAALGLVGQKPEKPGLESEPVGRIPSPSSSPQAIRLAGRKTLSLQMLAREPLIIREPGSGTRCTFRKGLERAGSSLDAMKISPEMGSNAAIKDAVRRGLGALVRLPLGGPTRTRVRAELSPSSGAWPRLYPVPLRGPSPPSAALARGHGVPPLPDGQPAPARRRTSAISGPYGLGCANRGRVRWIIPGPRSRWTHDRRPGGALGRRLPGEGRSRRELVQEEPRLSLELIRSVAPRAAGESIDVGGGASVLVIRLIDLPFEEVAVLDVSETALGKAKARLGERAGRVRWITADVIGAPDLGRFDVWHDRAVFHFLTDPVRTEGAISSSPRGPFPQGGTSSSPPSPMTARSSAATSTCVAITPTHWPPSWARASRSSGRPGRRTRHLRARRSRSPTESSGDNQPNRCPGLRRGELRGLPGRVPQRGRLRRESPRPEVDRFGARRVAPVRCRRRCPATPPLRRPA